MHSKKLHTAGLVVVKEGKLLLAFSKNKQAWYLPGGKVDAGETSQEALLREIREELNANLDANQLMFYTHISAPAYGEDCLQMEQDCFIYPPLNGIAPGNEIGAIRYFSLEAYLEEPAQVIGTLEVFKKLEEDKIL